MADTNNKHNKAVDLVEKELDKIGFVIVETETTKVDIVATKNGKTYYFIVIMGTKQKNRSIYAGININSWRFVSEKSNNTFFVAVIESESGNKFYYYTPTEMWACSNKPYVHIKCNPLKKPYYELKDFNDESFSERYKGSKKLRKGLIKMSELYNRLQTAAQAIQI